MLFWKIERDLDCLRRNRVIALCRGPFTRHKDVWMDEYVLIEMAKSIHRSIERSIMLVAWCLPFGAETSECSNYCCCWCGESWMPRLGAEREVNKCVCLSWFGNAKNSDQDFAVSIHCDRLGKLTNRRNNRKSGWLPACLVRFNHACNVSEQRSLWHHSSKKRQTASLKLIPTARSLTHSLARTVFGKLHTVAACFLTLILVWKWSERVISCFRNLKRSSWACSSFFSLSGQFIDHPLSFSLSCQIACSSSLES